MKALNAPSNVDRDRLEVEKQRLEETISRSVELLLKGTITESEAEKVLPKFRQRIAELAQELSFLKTPFKVANLLETAVSRYRANLDRLAASISTHLANGENAPANAVRDLIDTVTIIPAPGGGPNRKSGSTGGWAHCWGTKLCRGERW